MNSQTRFLTFHLLGEKQPIHQNEHSPVFYFYILYHKKSDNFASQSNVKTLIAKSKSN